MCQLAVEFANRSNNRFFLLRFHQVDDFRRRSHAAHFAAFEVLAVEQVVEYLGQFRQCGWLYAAERGDTQHHVMAQTLIKQGKNIGSLTTFEVDEDGGDNLRVLVANKVGGTLRFHKVERFDTAGGIAGFENILQQAGSTLFAERFHQYRTQVVVGVDVQRRKLLCFGFKFLQHFHQLLI